MNKYTLITTGLIIVTVLAGFLLLLPTVQAPITEVDNGQKTANAIHAFGHVTLSVGEKAQFTGISIRPLSIEEESRCPSDVQCIQAGTVRAAIEIVSGMGTSTSILGLGEFVTTEAEQVTFVSASPVPVSGAHIPNSAYALTFEVVQRNIFKESAEREVTVTPEPDVPHEKKCYVGGCSSQLCSDEPGRASTCEYREEYACYKSAVCEVQPSGQCGWTPTASFTACLNTADVSSAEDAFVY